MRLAVEVRWTSQFVYGDPHRLLTELCGDSGGHRCRTVAFDFLWVDYIRSGPLVSFFVSFALVVASLLLQRQRLDHVSHGLVAQRRIITVCNRLSGHISTWVNSLERLR